MNAATLTAPPPRAAPAPPAMPGLASRLAPPLRLPAAHFAAALAFWAVGAAGLVWIAPDLAAGRFAASPVAAVTHLFTLGWITTSILGALYQFLPVALGVPIRWQRAAWVTLALHLPGLPVFLGGFLLGRPVLMIAGAAAFGSGLLLFTVNLAATLARAPERTLTWWALAGAAGSLAATVILGGSLAGNLRWGYLGADRFLAVGVHLHVALAGWVLLTIAGVAHRLLPMFLLSHGASELPGRIAVGLLGAGVAALSALHHHLTPFLTWAIGVTLAAGTFALVLQAALHFRLRRRPVLDPGMRLAAGGLATLMVALAVAPFFVSGGTGSPRIATAYVLAAIGAVSLFVAGHYYRIVPFLVWFHRFGPLVGKGAVPRVADLYGRRPASAAAALLCAATWMLITAPLLGSVVLARAGAVLMLAGTLIVAAQMLDVARRRPQPAQPEQESR